jgi:ribose-phosphate pyrophosphokinase
MQPLLFALNGAPTLAASLQQQLNAEVGACTLRHFPDGECYLRLDNAVAGRDVVLLCGLEQPNQHLLPALFFADTAREFGAARIGLVTPYLAYMRQDTRFQPGEAITSRSFAALLSRTFDWLVTVDPHLHRYRELGEIYTIPTRAVTAAPALARALAERRDTFLLGPDSESEQWVAAIGAAANLPWAVASKERHGDRDVEITLPDLSRMQGRQPIIVDDVISSGTTLLRAAALLRERGFSAPHCVCVHPLFAEKAYEKLLDDGVAEILSCNTIAHVSNGVDVAVPISAAVNKLLGGLRQDVSRL